MKTKILFFLLAGGLLALAAWLVHKPDAVISVEVEPKPGQPDVVPKKYGETVQKGLEYLVKNQCQDGHWEGDGGNHPVAMTGLVGLALLMERDGPSDRRERATVRAAKYAVNIRKAVDWLMGKSQPGREGLIFSEHPSETARYMQGHGLATLFLAGACKDETDEVRRKKLTDVLLRAVKYIVKAQSSQGGWYSTSRVEGHDFDAISATVIQIQALQAAENAGVPVPSAAINDAQEYLKMALGKDEEKAQPGLNRSRPADTAAALACRCSATDELRTKWFKYCQTEIPVGHGIKFGRDELAHYYYAQAVFKLGGNVWRCYRMAVFDHLQSSQNKDGSWPACDGISAGAVDATAMWCTILQLDERSHPSRQLELGAGY